jgi:hypothetical protein
MLFFKFSIKWHFHQKSSKMCYFCKKCDLAKNNFLVFLPKFDFLNKTFSLIFHPKSFIFTKKINYSSTPPLLEVNFSEKCHFLVIFVMLFVNLDGGMNFFLSKLPWSLLWFFSQNFKNSDGWMVGVGRPPPILIMMVYITGGGDGGVGRRVD